MRRAFVTVGSRQVHLRRAGSGPPALLLHESPRSSAVLADVVEALAPRFTAIALDTPGYGLSDPLPLDRPEVADYAAAALEAADALGLERFALYGARTGAATAWELARLAPARVAGLVVDALPLFTDAESAELLERFLPPLVPDPYGTHLVWLWNRWRDQHLFFPWYDRRLETRLDADLPPARELHDGVLDVLRGASGYGLAPAAAFRWRLPPGGPPPVPLVAVAREDDFLRSHLERLPDRIEREALPRERALWTARVAELLARLAPEREAPPQPETAPVPGRISKTYADTSFGQLLVRRQLDADGSAPPLALLHASPASAALLEPLMRRLAPGRPVLAFDTLGNGDSDKPPWREAAIADYAPVVAEALAALGLDEVDLYGTHTGALIAAETAILRPRLVGRLVLEGVHLWDDELAHDLLARYTPPLEPRDDGSHLVLAWSFLRDQTLFWPWYRRTRAGIRRVEPVEAEALHRWCVELLKSGETYPIAYRAAFAWPARERLPLVPVPTLVVTTADDMLDEYSAEAAALLPAGRALTAPPRGVADAIEEFLR
jgi:pimeloyl-ACP methyl ester carboxylesterase